MVTNNVAAQADKLPVHDAKDIAIRIATVVCFAILAHLLIRLLQFITDWLIRKSAAKKSPVGFVTGKPAFVTLTGLVSSALTLVIYSVALGFILQCRLRGAHPTIRRDVSRHRVRGGFCRRFLLARARARRHHGPDVDFYGYVGSGRYGGNFRIRWTRGKRGLAFHRSAEF